MKDHIHEQLRGFASPVDPSKPHNYLIVFDSERRSHYLDRYAPGSVTLCRIGAALADMEHDPRGYLGGVDCDHCRDVLTERVIHKAEPRSETDPHCVVCGQRVKRVPGGQGPTWIHTDSGAVAAPNPGGAYA